MKVLVWVAFGTTLGFAVLHGALGLRAPRDARHLSFAWVMAALAGFLYFEQELYAAQNVRDAVEAVRHQVIMGQLLIGCLLVFVPAYTRVHIPRWVLGSLAGVLAVLFVVNLVAPYGLWFSGEPQLVHELFRGSPYTTVMAPPPTVLQVVYATYQLGLFTLAFACAVLMVRRGDRQRGWVLAAASVIMIGHALTDVIRDAVGGTWPYVGEYGVVLWGLIMSVQLAQDFRSQANRLAAAIADAAANAERLTSILGALQALERDIAAPLHTLETGIGTFASPTARDDAELERLRRAVTRLRALSRSMPDTHD